MPDSRGPGRAAVNALRALLERHNHIVQEVDGQNDFGEDLHVTFTENGAVTGDLVKIQVKGGRSWRKAQLGEMAGVEFGPWDIVQHQVNVHGEDLIFWQRPGEGFATLLHSDLDWCPEPYGVEHFHPGGRPSLLPGVPLVADTIPSKGEAQWLAACFDAALWAREPADGDPPLVTNTAARDSYVARRVEHHLWVDPDAMTRSRQALRVEAATDRELAAVIENTPGAVSVLFDRLNLGDTFWPEESFVRRASAEPR
ncbi:DUF4365 domain-containing protein [Actinokineospora auranticolor]|uniref:Uncharacterized protein DUF4365 n=1 Tax=Actinokineospora auranticolor TaxID=155976 RepID=A0A2S6H033_9PSEU|nr:DUF4365 domain-containing protein [Actinokineospora auranticolor]PPK70849.1 uncharacterized protein DUF4365 [Actinokineospora auranticolor]